MAFNLIQIQAELDAALVFIDNYTQNTYPSFLSDDFVLGNYFLEEQNRFYNVSFVEQQSVYALACLLAYVATNDHNWATKGTDALDAIQTHFLVGGNLQSQIVATGSQFEDIYTTNVFASGVYATVSFTSGVTVLPSNLSQVFLVYSSDLTHRNTQATALETYEIDYWVHNGYAVDKEGNRSPTADPNGTVQLVDVGFNGNLNIIYSIESVNSINQNDNIAFYPVLGSFSEPILASWTTIDAFQLGFDLFGTLGYQTIVNNLTNNINSYTNPVTYFYRKQNNAFGNLLKYLNLSNDGAGALNLTALTDRLQIDVSSPNSQVNLANIVHQAILNPVNNLEINTRCTVDTAIKIIVNDEWTSNLLINNTFQTYLINLTDFYQTLADTFTIDSSYLTTGTVSIIADTINYLSFDINGNVFQINLDLNETFTTDFDVFGDILPKIIYKSSEDILIRFTSNAYITYETTLVATGSVYSVFDSSWLSSFGVSNQTLKSVEFVSLTNGTELCIWTIGHLPVIAQADLTINKLEIINPAIAPYTWQIGDVLVNNNPLDNLPYTPNVIPTKYQTDLTENVRFDLRNQKPVKAISANKKQLFIDAANQFLIDKGFTGIYTQFLPYNPENIQFVGGFNEQNLNLPGLLLFLSLNPINVIANTYNFNQFRSTNIEDFYYAYLDLAQYYRATNDPAVFNILQEYLIKLNDYFISINPSLRPPTEFDPVFSATTDNPGYAALIGLTALQCNIAGIEQQISLDILNICTDYLTNNFQSTGTMAGSWSALQADEGIYKRYRQVWHAYIIYFYADLIRNAALIRELNNIGDLPVFPDLVVDYQNQPFHYTESYDSKAFQEIYQKYADGNEQRLLRHDNPFNRIINYRYEHITTENLNKFIQFYDGIKGTNSPFVFNTVQINTDDFDGVWVFDDVPNVETVISSNEGGIFNVTGTIREFNPLVVPLLDKIIVNPGNDNDFDLIITPNPLSITSGSSELLSIRINRQIDQNVTITFNSDDTNLINITGSPITFTPFDWFINQTIIVTAEPNLSNENTFINIDPIKLNACDMLTIDPIPVTVLDNPFQQFIFTQQDEFTILADYQQFNFTEQDENTILANYQQFIFTQQDESTL